MSLKSDALETVLVIGAVGLGLWWLERKITGGAAAVGAAISDGASSAWNTATTPVDLGNSTASDIGSGIVDAPANTLDALSLGMISGSGGTSGNGGLGSWLWNIVNGNAFAPASAQAPNLGPVDYGTSGAAW
ncbi:hypothetical protein [Trinickia symbiotica]|uniref:Uncharacterized protein n=1 Tax=Trinickia symbiotica TaxID=863227 RepID=A0A2N7XA91_9BURK|nr:hypothetical protein [Trinickia symbiotica]PMS38462.1 hypothetical protein C0Z20_00830 [Trinickia symbiotica]